MWKYLQHTTPVQHTTPICIVRCKLLMISSVFLTGQHIRAETLIYQQVYLLWPLATKHRRSKILTWPVCGLYHGVNNRFEGKCLCNFMKRWWYDGIICSLCVQQYIDLLLIPFFNWNLRYSLRFLSIRNELKAGLYDGVFLCQSIWLLAFF